MSELPLLKAVEVLGVVCAGAGFVWWQLRDIKRDQELARRKRLTQEAQPSPPAPAEAVRTDHPPSGGTPAP